MNELMGMSADQLERLAARATKMAGDLRAAEPTLDLALAAGVRDKSYSTVRYGRVASYAGEAEVTMADGRRFRAIGHGPRGDAETLDRGGYVEFVPLA